MDTGVKVVDKRKNWEARVEMAVFKLPKEELGTYEKLVYAVLCGHASRDGSARLYMKTIADEASCSERQARRSIACLEACNLVARHTQITAGDGQTCNVYEVLGIDEYISD
jgi:predicted transcriptional regulator